MGSSESKYSGYEPRPELKGRLELLEAEYGDEDDERLIGTFAFEPCEWQKIFWGKKEHPVRLGSIDGIGHLTTKRIVLFWDVEAALSAKNTRLAGEVASKLAEGAGQAVLGGVIGALTKISSRTREFMEARAEEWSRTHGIASWFHEDGEWCMTSDGIFFAVPDYNLGPAPAITFRPGYVDDDWKADYAAEFEKLLKRVNISPKRVNSIIRDSDGLVTKYISN